MLQSLKFLFVFLFVILVSTPTFAAETKMHLWGEIPFLAAGNFNEFQNIMKHTRDDTRKILLEEFGSLYLPSVMYGADAESAAHAIANVMITFDRMHDEHVAKANIGIPKALEQQLIAHFDSLYRDLGLTDNERRAVFTRNGGWNEALRKMRRNNLSNTERAKLYLEWLTGVDYLLYGSYTVIQGGAVSLTLTMEDYKTGNTKTLLAKGPIEIAVQNLAVELFRELQKNKYPQWKNPSSHLEWLLPAESMGKKNLPREVKLYCQGQNARVPYAQELILASQGTEFRSGGIPQIRDTDIFFVADLQRTVENYFYFGKTYTGDDPRGPVRSGAGFGVIYPRFVCVRGEVSPAVRAEQDFYRAYRNVASSSLNENDRSQAQTAIEFLLLRMDAPGARALYNNSFPNSAAALSALAKLGFSFSDELKAQLME